MKFLIASTVRKGMYGPGPLNLTKYTWYVPYAATKMQKSGVFLAQVEIELNAIIKLMICYGPQDTICRLTHRNDGCFTKNQWVMLINA